MKLKIFLENDPKMSSSLEFLCCVSSPHLIHLSASVGILFPLCSTVDPRPPSRARYATGCAVIEWCVFFA